MKLPKISTVVTTISRRATTTWTWFRALPRLQQIVAGIIAAALLIGVILVIRGGTSPEESGNQEASVTLESIGTLSGGGSTVQLIGTVRSMSEASILAQAGGTVRVVHARLGSSVGAGAVLAELENSSESASVLQAQGAYDAAIAARNAQSLPDTQFSARTAYQTAFTNLDTLLHSNVDTFFGSPTPNGPQLLISADMDTGVRLSKTRAHITDLMNTWQSNLSTAEKADPLTLLSEAQTTGDAVVSFLGDLAVAANKNNSGVTSSQSAALASARTTANATLSSITAARASYRGGTTSSTAGADASVKQALGMLRGAQAQLEKTLLRAPISGTVNFLPIRVGDYVTPLMHVATVAQNGALEVVAYVGESDRTLLTVGQKLTINESTQAVVTSIAPALDPVTKQIEIHLAVTGQSDLVNGAAVHISLPNVLAAPTPKTAGPLLLPLASVKLESDKRIVFSVDADGRLVAHDVQIGDVRGDRIEIRTELPTDLQIVTDARGLSAGQKVRIAPSTI